MTTALRRSVEIGVESLGGDCAQFLAATRPGAQGAVLLHSALPVKMFGRGAWPAGVTSLADYDADATELLWSRVLAFLSGAT